MFSKSSIVKMFTYSFTGLFVYLFIGLFLHYAYAQQNPFGLDLTVSPAIIELSNIPGTKIQSRFRIRNNLDRPINLQLSVSKLATNDLTDSIEPVESQPGDDFLSWLKFDNASVSALPKEWTDVRFTIELPKNAAFGYYYAIRIRQATSLDNANNTTTKLLGEVLIPVLVDVQRAGASSSVQILDFKTSSFVNEYLPVEFITRIKNTGNVHIRPRGNIFISLGGDKDAAMLDINPNQGIILPGSARNFSSDWDEGFLVRQPVISDDGTAKLDKNGKPIMHLAFNWDKLTDFRIGKYTATALVVYNNGARDVAVEKTTQFWVFPYTIIGITFIAIVILFILTRFLLGWYVKGQISRYKMKI